MPDTTGEKGIQPHMRIYLLRTTAGTPGYEAIEADSNGDISRIARNDAAPQAAFDPLTDDGQFIHAVMCQGVSVVGYDHYAVRPGSIVRLTAWNDDPEDWPQPWGIEWEFRTPRQDWTPGIDGRINTSQTCTVYGNDAYLAGETTTGGAVIHLPWSSFVEPPKALTFHGVWTDDTRNDEHMAAVAQGDRDHGWREWVG